MALFDSAGWPLINRAALCLEMNNVGINGRGLQWSAECHGQKSVDVSTVAQFYNIGHAYRLFRRGGVATIWQFAIYAEYEPKRSHVVDFLFVLGRIECDTNIVW